MHLLLAGIVNSLAIENHLHQSVYQMKLSTSLSGSLLLFLTLAWNGIYIYVAGAIQYEYCLKFVQFIYIKII